MVDGDSTTVEWQRHPGDILVLPVGAFEQHDAHLPLTTDTIHAEHFARLIATELDAALLPAQAIATSLEHTGFRGTFSLRPETLMQVVRDLADEAERQNFRMLVVVNGHGGNFCLIPVCRDINRQDRRVKILLVSPHEFGDGGLTESPGKGLPDLHAGESETSRLLAEKPEAVRPSGPGPQLAGGLNRSDLTTFGVGHFNPAGACGHYELASREKGEALTRSIVKNMMPHLRDRIDRLRAQPRYAGPGGLELRPMNRNDLPELDRLVVQAGWNQLPGDWDFFLAANPAGCFVCVHQGRVVGSVATIAYGGEVAWLGMVLVDVDFRKQGIATRLMRQAMEAMRACRVIRLDATPAGRPVYAKLGFADEFRLTRMVNPAVGLPGATPRQENIQPLQPEDLAAVCALDQEVFGADRSNLIGHLVEKHPQYCRKRVHAGRIDGFALGRPGRNFVQLGPVVADNPGTAEALLRDQLAAMPGSAAVADVFEAQTRLVQSLGELGFAPQRPFVRMRFGDGIPAGDPERYFTIAGPEFG